MALGLLALGVYAWLAVQVYRAQRDPEHFEAWDGPYAWIVGPSGKSLEAAAEHHIDQGLAVLNNTATLPAERLEAYRAHLKSTEALLVRSLRANPAQARALARLAAVRWELDPPQTEEAVRRHLELIALASRMAPQVPKIQQELGELLLRMGRQPEGLAYLRRTIELDGKTAWPIVKLLREYLLTSAEILAALPRNPETLMALQSAYVEEGKEAEYLDLLEASIEGPSSGIVETYGNVCLRARQPDRLRRRLEMMSPRDDPVLEAQRRIQIGRSYLALGDTARAVREAREARMAQPEAPLTLEQIGQLMLAAEQAEEALIAFRGAIARVARGSGDPGARARLYREMGQAEERAGRADHAYDAYKKALELNPEEGFAKNRMAQMRKAAGTQ